MKLRYCRCCGILGTHIYVVGSNLWMNTSCHSHFNRQDAFARGWCTCFYYVETTFIPISYRQRSISLAHVCRANFMTNAHKVQPIKAKARILYLNSSQLICYRKNTDYMTHMRRTSNMCLYHSCRRHSINVVKHLNSTVSIQQTIFCVAIHWAQILTIIINTF